MITHIRIIKNDAKTICNSYKNHRKYSKTYWIIHKKIIKMSQNHLVIHTQIIKMSQTLPNNSYKNYKKLAKPHDYPYTNH